MPTVKLYGYGNSPFVRKTACFLFYKGIDFTHVKVNPVRPKETIGFTKGSRVPVLEIDGEWRLESSTHACWLDEVFPEKPVCPKEHKPKIEAIDRWINETYLPSIFRPAIDGKFDFQYCRNGWRLAALMHANAPLPITFRVLWPLVLKRVPFVQAMASQINLDESFDEMHVRLAEELAVHIGDGPYMGGLAQPSMLDLAVFPNVMWNYLVGIENEVVLAKNLIVKSWLMRMSQHLPDYPSLTPDDMLVKSVAQAFEAAEVCVVI